MNKTTNEPLPLFRNPWFKIGVAVTLLLVAIFCLTDLPGAATLRRIISETLEAASAETQREREKPAAGNAELSRFDYRDGERVQGEGEVVRILADDLEPPRHQRFIIADADGKTLLVAHNIDLSPRVAGLEIGERVQFRGEYRANANGGVIHLTHPDPRGKYAAGWVRKVRRDAAPEPAAPGRGHRK